VVLPVRYGVIALLLDRGVSWEDVAQALSVKVILLDVASV